MRLHLASLLFFVTTAACTSDTGTTNDQLQTSPDPTATYRVVVSLASAGAGIDTDAQSDVMGVVNTYDIDLSPDLHEWGLEGERNLCFALTGLNPQAQSIFIDKLAEVAETGQLVFVYENARCDTLGE